MPQKSERMLGGHAVMAVGYDQTKKRLLMRNS
jgi:C1A family cysteine protease